MLNRRNMLTGTAAGLGTILLAGCVPTPGPDYPDQSGEPFEGIGPFPSGVGSGDPTPTAVLLWTRVHPERDRGAGVDVRVLVAASPSFGPTTVIDSRVTATARRDHCVTFDASGLEPGRTYWYRFSYDGHTSPLGRTRTAPAGPVDHLRLAAFSCQRWTHGFFTAHADLAALADDPDTDVDLVLSLGDYVYETGYADDVYVPGRDDPIQHARTLAEFRSKYRLYRSDPNLQAMHAAYPVMHVFDNHDGMSDPFDPQGPAALAAFFEHLPVRTRARGRIDRSLRWGDLAEVFLTDQRSFRDPTIRGDSPLGTWTGARPEILDPTRTMLGAEQRQWLVDGLVGSSAQWKVIGSQLMFWPWRSFGRLPWEPRGSGSYLNLAQWDGYAAERLTVLDALEAADVRDTILYSGDSHVFSAAQVAPDVDDAASVPRVVEFGTGSITSSNSDEQGLPTGDVSRPLLFSVNPHHLRYFESERHGYVISDITPTEVRTEVRSPRSVRHAASPTDTLARFRVRSGSQRVEVLSAASASTATAAAAAPR